MQRSLWIVCAVVATVAACKKPVKLNLKPDDIRAEVLANVKPFLDRPEYAITDADIVDPCLTEGLARGGYSRTSAVGIASTCIKTSLDQPAGLARLEKKIAQRYANPVITRSGDKVTIDAGVVPGKLEIVRGTTQLGASPQLDGREWATSEVTRFLKLAIAKHPDARTYTATCLIPEKFAGPRWTYTYDRAADHLEVTAQHRDNLVYVSGNLGGNLDGVRSTKTTDLTARPR